MKLFPRSHKTLPIIEQNKTKMAGKIGSAWLNYCKQQTIVTIHKLSAYSVQQSCLKFTDTMDLLIRMRIFNSAKCLNATFSKFGDIISTFITKLVLKAKYLQIFRLLQVFGICYCCLSQHILIRKSVSQRNIVCHTNH